MPLRSHPTPVLVPPTDAVDDVTYRHPISIVTQSADLPTSVIDMLTRLQEPPDAPADLKVAVNMWPACRGTMEGRQTVPHGQPEFMEKGGQGQARRAHHPGVPPGHGGPFRRSEVMGGSTREHCGLSGEGKQGHYTSIFVTGDRRPRRDRWPAMGGRGR
jgi:hypothetical protein